MSDSKTPHTELLWAYENSVLVRSMVVACQPWQCIVAELVREKQRLLDEVTRLMSSRMPPLHVMLPPELARNHIPKINPNTSQ